MSQFPIARPSPLLLALMLVLATLATASVMAQELSSDRTTVGQVRYLEDPDGQWVIADLLDRQDWQTTTGRFNQGYSRSTWWLKVPLANPGSDTLTRYLEVGYAMLDHLDVYIVDDGKVVQRYSFGDKQPFARRLVDHQHFIVPMQLPPGPERSLYLRIQSGSIIQAPMTFWSPDAFLETNFDRLFTSGLLFGALLVIAAYNLLLAFGLRDKTYLFYVGYVLCLTVFLASMDGLAFRFLWPNATHWNDQLIVMSLLALTMFAGLFARSLLDMPRFSRPLNIVTLTHLALTLLAMLLSFAMPYDVAIKLGMLATLSGSIISIWAGPSAWYHKQPAGRYYTYAWSVLFLCTFVHLFGRLGVYDVPWLTDNILGIGVIAEVLILSLALGERINSERRQRIAAQREALAAEDRATAELEERVSQRNRELATLNTQLKTLTQTDQLTSLSNRRNFESHLNKEFNRCRRNNRPLTIALIDVDHFKRVNDRWGHPMGDICLQALARRMEEAADRAGAMAARLGGEEFCLLLPEVDTTEANAIAEKLRIAIEETPVTGAEETIHVTVSIGIATAIPLPEDNAEQLLKGADHAMYQAKNSGRNRISNAPSPGKRSHPLHLL